MKYIQKAIEEKVMLNATIQSNIINTEGKIYGEAVGFICLVQEVITNIIKT